MAAERKKTRPTRSGGGWGRGDCGGAVGSEGPSNFRIKQSCEGTANEAIASMPLFPALLVSPSTLYIFNWLHRRLSTDLEYCRVPHQKKHDVFVECVAGEKAGTEKEALLLELDKVASFQNFLDGILTIGTLGHLDDKCLEDSIDAQEQEQEREQVELIASSGPLRHPVAIESFKKEIVLEEDLKAMKRGDDAADEEDALEPLLKATKSEKRERVTLADLMASERHHGDEGDLTGQATSVYGMTARGIKGKRESDKAVVAATSLCCAKHGKTLTKKLLLPKKVGKDSPPPASRKIHQSSLNNGQEWQRMIFVHECMYGRVNQCEKTTLPKVCEADKLANNGQKRRETSLVLNRADLAVN
ncbi:unnamed protein product [Spirodela intermedia]|uniref:Protein TILLER ANGLE CONTROL 1 n=1 Tax=Spirodela intermedia TaxID=51605 RepID=A0A7I8J9K1_SPIIN|nr:unnamed protein product [Spirodela intermedia]CAA6666898.1 unnamed protein product [Spirodela intermedia]